MADNNTCLFIGRFQPFHRGHLMVIQGMAKLCDRIVIVIGSCKKANTADNPFTVEERQEMIQRALQDVDIIPKHDVAFVEVPDTDSDPEWADNVLDAVGDVKVLWTGNDHTKQCFTEKDIEIQDIKEVPGISGTEIRKRMNAGGDWNELVPNVVAAYLNSINGPERLKSL